MPSRRRDVVALPTGSCPPTATGATSSAAGTARPPARPVPSGPPRSATWARSPAAAEQLGFEAALTPTGAWCEDAWLATSMLAEVTERLKFLVAFRPGLTSPLLAAQMAATFQRFSRRPRAAQRGDRRRDPPSSGPTVTSWTRPQRYRALREFLDIVRRLWRGRDRRPSTVSTCAVEGARLARCPTRCPRCTSAARRPRRRPVAARYSDVYLTWGEPPAAVDAKLRWMAGWPGRPGAPSATASGCT